MASQQVENYTEQGFVLLREVFRPADFEPFNRAFLNCVHQHTDQRFESMHDPELVTFFQANMDVESDVYNAIRTTPEIKEMALDSRIVAAINSIVDTPYGLFEKMILRIDLPELAGEVAHWHQDYHFVQGNTDVITVWMPLQDVNLENGCLLIQPASHKLGVVAHDDRIGKRDVPGQSVIDTFKPVPVDMNHGDVLLFHSLLFHSGQLNQSNRTRYSFQFRYTPLDKPTHPAMGQVFPLT